MAHSDHGDHVAEILAPSCRPLAQIEQRGDGYMVSELKVIPATLDDPSAIEAIEAGPAATVGEAVWLAISVIASMGMKAYLEAESEKSDAEVRQPVEPLII